MKKTILTILFLAFGMSLSAAEVIRQDKVKFGRPAASTDKILEADVGSGLTNPKVFFSDTNSRWEYTDDGTIDKPFGTGGGGVAINLLQEYNPDFESGITGWTASTPAHLTAVTGVSALFGNGSGAWDATAGADTLESSAPTIADGLESRNCIATFHYEYPETAGASRITFSVEDGAANTLATMDLAITEADKATSAYLSFICPASGTAKMVLTASADPAILTLDNAFLGSNYLVTQLSQAEYYGTLKYDALTNCIWTSTAGTWTVYAADSDCPAPDVGLNAVAPATKIPGISFDILPPGIYEVTINTWFEADASSTATTCRWQITDGVAGRGTVHASATSTNATLIENSSIVAYYIYDTAQSSTTFQLEVQRDIGDGNCDIQGDLSKTWIMVKRFPLESQTAYTPDVMNWFVDVNIGGANPSMGTGDEAAYVPIEHATLDMVINPGSIAAEISCDGVNPSTGLTCSVGIEQVGVVFNVPRAGKVEVCGEFAHSVNLGISTAVATTFQWTETSNTSETILAEGNSRVMSELATTADAGMTIKHPVHVCGIFNFGSAGEKTLRLMYEQETTIGTVNNNLVIGDRLAAEGQRDIHVTIRPIDQQNPMPQLVNSVVNPAAGVTRMASAYIEASDATPELIRQDGDWIDSIDDNGVGNYDINWATGFFSDVPNCVASIVGADTCLRIDTGIDVNILTFTCTTAAAAEADFFVTCIGPR